MLDAFRFSLAISGHNDGLSSVIGKGMPTLARSQTEGKIIAKLTSEKEGDGTAAFGRSFDSWAKLRMELLRANVLSPAYLTHAEDNFYRGESWQSPDTVPMTDGQMKEMKLKSDQKAVSGCELSPFSFPTFPVIC
jgi:hypothetical protein